MQPVMSGYILALATLFPAPASAQDEEVRAPWVMEVAGGIALRPGDATARSLGFSQAISVGRMLTDRTSWRGTIEFDTWRPPSCTDDPCPSLESLSMLAFSAGFVATGVSHHREFYATARAGVYMLVDTPAPSPGGYVGVGAAIPVNRAALTIEAGLQAYYYMAGPGPDDASPGTGGRPSPDHDTWAIPIRVGYRWAL